MYYAKYQSPVGPLLLICDDEGLTGLWMDRDAPACDDCHSVLEQAKRWLDSYFRGEGLPVDVPLKPAGTPFQRQVWRILLDIPFGQTRSYGDIAREMAVLTGREKMSAQAVGQAVGKNPISIIIPCHRVVGAKGQLTGYAGGLEKKIWLLEHEKGRLPLPVGEVAARSADGEGAKA